MYNYHKIVGETTNFNNLISGESHYKAWEQPHIYFQVLTLTGQWEAALDFLVHSDKYAVDAVHMALALHQLHLLALPATSNSPLLVIDESDKPPLRRLNLLRLVLLHTQKFEVSDPKETLHYYYCLRELTSNDGKNAFVSCVTNLVLESKLYDVILGVLLEDGCRQPGLIDQFQSSQISVREIIENVAEATEQKGLYEDAVKLYDLCGIHEKVLSLMNMLVGQVVGKRCSGGNTQRGRLARTAASICQKFDGIRLTCQPSTLSTFYLLLDLMEFFDLYHTKQYAVALEVMHKTRILPQSSSEMDEKVSNFKLLDETVCRNIPEILLAVMNIYHQQYIQAQGDIASNKLEDPVHSKKLSYLREQARLITTFTGTIPYRMPSSTNSKLVQLEILMN